jgi:hypothetical protein
LPQAASARQRDRADGDGQVSPPVAAAPSVSAACRHRHDNGGPGDDQLDEAGGGGGRMLYSGDVTVPSATYNARGSRFTVGQPGTVHVAPWRANAVDSMFGHPRAPSCSPVLRADDRT